MATKNILVVDRDQGIRDLLVLLLGEEGYGVTTSSSLSQAVRLLSQSNFDLIITEAFGQKDIFTFDPTYLAKYKEVAPNTPVILFSSYVDKNYPMPRQYGLAAEFPKMNDIFDLVNKVKKVLGEQPDDKAR